MKGELKRIGIDCRLWNESGVGRYIRNLVINLAEIDAKNTYVLFVLSKNLEDIKHQLAVSKYGKGWEVVEANIHWHGVAEQVRFPQLINKERLDLMHFPYFSVPLRYRGKYVVTIHDLILHHFSTGESSTLPGVVYKTKLYGYRHVIKKAAQNAEKIIAPSVATKKELIDHLKISEEKIAVTYEGVDSEVDVVQHDAEKGHFENKRFFLYVGNAYPHKNLQRLVDAFISVQKKIPEVHLVFVGPNDFFYKKIENKIMHDNILFLHKIGDQELGALYRDAEALVIPSLMEGFGLPGIEAMRNRCLVVCSEIPVFKELYKKYALYFDPESTESLAGVLTDVLKKDSVKKGDMKNSASDYSTVFTWEKMAQETLDVYVDCFEKR